MPHRSLLLFFVGILLPLRGTDSTNLAKFKPNLNIPPHLMQMVYGEELERRSEEIISKIQDPTCLAHIRALFDGVKKREYWALNMLDASMKIPQGVLEVQTWFVGNYDQCLKIQDVQTDAGSFSGQHCMARLCTADGPCQEKLAETVQKGLPLLEQLKKGHVIPEFLARAKAAVNTSSFHFGFCLPSSCSPSDIETVLNGAIGQLTKDIHANIRPGDCNVAEGLEFHVMDYIPLAIFTAILAMIICSTFYDLTHLNSSNRIELFVVYSAYTNLKKLFATSDSENSLKCLHGIRFISICYVLLGHTFVGRAMLPLTNALYFKEILQSKRSVLVLMGVFSVDTFFLLSGLLLCYVFFNMMSEKYSMNFKLFYLHRFLRLTPPLAAALLMEYSLTKKLNSGPMWKNLLLNDCKTNWYEVLFYIKNYFPRSSCMAHTWYVSADTQLYCISPLLLLTLWKNPRRGLQLTAIAIFFNIIYAFLYAYIWKIPSPITPFFFQTSEATQGSSYLYLSTEIRSGPWFIGIILGYIIHRIKRGELIIKMNQYQVVALWTYVFVVAVGCVASLYSFVQTEHVYYRFPESVYNSVIHNLWASVLFLMILACVTGYGGVVNKMLSHAFWTPWSRLTYAIYLLHPMLMRHTAANARFSYYLADTIVVRNWFSMTVLSIAAAILLNLMFESPTAALEKILMRTPKRSRGLKTTSDETEDVESTVRTKKGYARLPTNELE